MSASYDFTAIALGRKEAANAAWAPSAAKRAAVATAKWLAVLMKECEDNVCKDCVKHHPLDYHNIGCCGHCELDGKCDGSPSMGDTLDASRPLSSVVVASLQALASANRAAAAPLKTRSERHIDEDGFAIEVELVDVDSDEE
jgi:hypothetical protein